MKSSSSGKTSNQLSPLFNVVQRAPWAPFFHAALRERASFLSTRANGARARYLILSSLAGFLSAFTLTVTCAQTADTTEGNHDVRVFRHAHERLRRAPGASQMQGFHGDGAAVRVRLSRQQKCCCDGASRWSAGRDRRHGSAFITSQVGDFLQVSARMVWEHEMAR
jgi:hypothetical protein